jgi:hypothetical protein
VPLCGIASSPTLPFLGVRIFLTPPAGGGDIGGSPLNLMAMFTGDRQGRDGQGLTAGQMRKDAEKEDYLKTIGLRLLRIPNGLVLEGPGGVRAPSAGADRDGPANQCPLTRLATLRSLSPGEGLKNVETPGKGTAFPQEAAKQFVMGRIVIWISLLGDRRYSNRCR